MGERTLKKRLCILQITPAVPNPDHVKMFSNKENCDFYFVTHDAEHPDALKFCPNTTWTDTRNVLYEMVPKEYEYYMFVDYDFLLRPMCDLNPLEQILEDLNEYEPAILTYYPGNGLITPLSNNEDYRKKFDYSVLPFAHAGFKAVHHSLLDWFFPMITDFGGGVDSCHLFNILEIPFLKNVVCSHKMIYDNGVSDSNAPHNRDGAKSKMNMDLMWNWILPSFRKNKLINLHSSTHHEKYDSLKIKKIFFDLFISKEIQPEKSSKNVNYFDQDRINSYFDTSHDYFQNKKCKFVDFCRTEKEKTDAQSILNSTITDFNVLKQKKNPWQALTNKINSEIKPKINFTPEELVDLYQKIPNNPSFFINVKKEDDLAEYLSGKTVAYVGPSPYLIGKNFGKKIDDYDVVIRINEGIYDTKDYGSRTDIIQSCLNFNYGPKVQQYLKSLHPSEHPKFILCNDTVVGQKYDGSWKTVREEWQEKYSSFNTKLIDLSNEDETHDRWGLYWEMYPKWHIEVHPEKGHIQHSSNFNSGYGAICMLSRYDIKELYITGIDFYNFAIPGSSDKKYNPMYYEKYGREGTPYGPDKMLHDQLCQMIHFKNVILPNRENIVLDNHLKENLFSEEIEKRLNLFKNISKYKHETR
jgi:hypothetical protein